MNYFSNFCWCSYTTSTNNISSYWVTISMHFFKHSHVSFYPNTINKFRVYHLNIYAVWVLPFALLTISNWCYCHFLAFIGFPCVHWFTLCHTYLAKTYSRNRCSCVFSAFWHITNWVVTSSPHLANLSIVSNLPCSCNHNVNLALGRAELPNTMLFHRTLHSSLINWIYICLAILFPFLNFHCMPSNIDLAFMIFLIIQHACWGTVMALIAWPLI